MRRILVAFATIFSIIFTFWWGELTKGEYYFTLLSVLFWGLALGVMFWSTNFENFFEVATFIPYWIAVSNCLAACLQKPILWLFTLFAPWFLINKTLTLWRRVLSGFKLVIPPTKIRILVFTFLPSLSAIAIDGINLGTIYLQGISMLYTVILVRSLSKRDCCEEVNC